MVNRVFSPSALFAADKLRVAARSGSPVNMEAIFSQVCGVRGAGCGVWWRTNTATQHGGHLLAGVRAGSAVGGVRCGGAYGQHCNMEASFLASAQ